MRNFIYILILPLSLLLAFTACKKGSISGEDGPSPNSFSSPQEKSFVNNTNGVAGSYVGATQSGTTAPDDEDDEDPTPTPTVQTIPNTLVYAGTTYNNPAVTSGSTASYYAISASVSSSSITCTVYFPSKPSGATSYSIEDITGNASPSSGKAWLVVSAAGAVNSATSGAVGVSISNSKIIAVFEDIDITPSATASGTLTGN